MTQSIARCAAAVLVGYLAATPLAQGPQTQTWEGVISDSTCGASHQAIAAGTGMSDRACAFHCLKGLAKYVVVDDRQNVIPIANQDFAGIPLRLARPVRVTGVLTDKGIIISRLEPPLVHAHIGHVMIAWRDTPGTVGLLTIALNDVRVAAAHAALIAKSSTLDDMKLHAGHVTHALDPALEKTGPASGYGAKRATAGALQHVGFAAGVEGASAAVKGRAGVVSSSLTAAAAGIDSAIAAAQKIRAAATLADATAGAGELQPLVEDIGRNLRESEQEMRLMVKDEGL